MKGNPAEEHILFSRGLSGHCEIGDGCLGLEQCQGTCCRTFSSHLQKGREESINHPFIDGFSMNSQQQLLGIPHDYGNHHIWRFPDELADRSIA